MSTELSLVENFNQQINRELLNKETQNALLATTFKGLTPILMKQALLEGMIRGFTFENFLKKDIYAIKFGDGYALIVAIDHARKVANRSGQTGKGAPVYTFDDTKKIETASVTVYKKNGHPGGYTATVYFSEYYKEGKYGKPSMWDTKPMTMIAKVAEMHALRQAFPEEFSKIYVEEEMEKEATVRAAEVMEEVEKKELTMSNFEVKNDKAATVNQEEVKEEDHGSVPGADSGKAVGAEVDLSEITESLR